MNVEGPVCIKKNKNKKSTEYLHFMETLKFHYI